MAQPRRRNARTTEAKRSEPLAPSVAKPSPPKVSIGFVASANAQFKALPDKLKRGLLQKLKELALHPGLGKPLIGSLQGCYRISYGSYRCVVRMTDGIAMVLVLVVAKRKAGSRDDAYTLALDLLRRSDPSVQEIFARHIRAHLEEQCRASGPPIDIPATVKGRSPRK